MYIIYEQMLSESKKIEQQIKLLQMQLENLPEGNIICSRNGKYFKWILTDGKNQTYLPKNERCLAEKLVFKKYLSLQLKNLQHEKMAIEFYLRHHDQGASQTELSFINSPKYQKLLSKFFKPLSQELCDWSKEPYKKNEKFPENLIHKTYSGNLVRSKSDLYFGVSIYDLITFIRTWFKFI